MSNIVVILSSPRKDGNSSTIAHKVMDGAMGLSTNIIQIYDLNDLKFVHGCDHCNSCKRSRGCRIDDDLKPIIEEAAKADYIVCATPLYFGRANSLFYLLIDRMYCYLGDNAKPFDKNKGIFVPIVTCDADVDIAGKLCDELSKTMSFLGFSTAKGIVFDSNGKYNAVDENVEICEVAHALGKSFT